MFILTSFTRPAASLTTFSMMGVSCLQGPHQGAQKSTSTGCWRDASSTSRVKAAVVVSLIRSSGIGPFGALEVLAGCPPKEAEPVIWVPKEP